MKKKKVIIMIVVPIILIGSIITYFIISFNNDRKETINKMDRISTLYEEFKEDVLEFNQIREDLYSNVFNGIYYDTLKVNYDVWKNKLSNYEETIDKINDQNSFLKKHCNGIYYPDHEINNKCSAFSIAYEEINNSFVYDIDLFNKNISNYNEYIEQQSSNNKLDLYKTDKKYIDYDDDGEYLGKEGESSNE